MTKIKRVIDRFSFLIDILECIGLCDRRVKEFKVSKHLVNMSVLFLIEKCVVQRIVVKHLVEANLHLAVELQSELII